MKEINSSIVSEVLIKIGICEGRAAGAVSTGTQPAGDWSDKKNNFQTWILIAWQAAASQSESRFYNYTPRNEV